MWDLEMQQRQCSVGSVSHSLRHAKSTSSSASASGFGLSIAPVCTLGDGLAAAFFFLVFFFFFGDDAAGGIVDVRAVADGGMAAKSTPLCAALLAALVVLPRALGCDAEVKCSRVRQAVAAGALARPFAAAVVASARLAPKLLRRARWVCARARALPRRHRTQNIRGGTYPGTLPSGPARANICTTILGNLLLRLSHTQCRRSF